MQYPLEMVLAFLEQYKLDKYCDNFKKYGINGNLLLEADDSALEELGITSALERLKIKVYTQKEVIEYDEVKRDGGYTLKATSD